MQTIAATKITLNGKYNKSIASTNNQRPRLPLLRDLAREAAGNSGLARNKLKELPGSPSPMDSTESERDSDSEL
ncbi:hypothetical protein MA16_Dca016672 [Dendrobium catenatum]|uniref:Uncharacterized protein n=1 Tax=Dendrobium catenatum TaxID=906689 RepID=A0A2I0XHU5_9ASPA|nr:hypothetical protein MA16_Dca016672 [Dendrobium catenatum]